MSLTADRKSYERPLILLQRLMALMILGLYAVGPSANRDIGRQFGEIHESLAHSLIAVAVGHALIALYHRLVLRDNIVGRMKP